MTDDQSAPRHTSDVPVNRRRFLITTSTLGIGMVLAGCGDGGPGVETGSPGEGPTETSPGGAEPGTETEAETPAETATETESEAPTETETSTETGDAARVRIAHLSPNAPNVDVYVDESLALEDVPFGAVSPYQDLASGTHTVEITAAGDSETSVFEGEVTLDAGTTYTLAALGEVGDGVDEPFEPRLLADDNDPPDSEMSRLRVVHASPDAPTVDLTAGETVLFDGVSFGEAAATEVPAGQYTVEIRGDTAQNDGEVVDSFEVGLEGGQGYTAFAAGYLAPEDAPADTPFELIVTQDAAAG